MCQDPANCGTQTSWRLNLLSKRTELQKITWVTSGALKIEDQKRTDQPCTLPFRAVGLSAHCGIEFFGLIKVLEIF